MGDFRKIEAWCEAMGLVVDLYKVTVQFPSDERFGLTKQVRRAAVSVPSNIAEGAERSRRDFARFLDTAAGSLAEVETQLLLSERLQFIAKCDVKRLFDRTARVGRLINGLRKSLRTD